MQGWRTAAEASALDLSHGKSKDCVLGAIVMKDLVIWGCGGHGREVAQIAEEVNVEKKIFNIIGFLDDRQSLHGTHLAGYLVLGGLAWLAENPQACVFVGIGSPAARYRTVARLRSVGATFAPPLVHPRAVLASRVVVGEGSVVFAGCVVSVDVVIGAHAILNLGTTISHDCVLGDFATAAPGVHVAGAVRVGEGCDLGTGTNTVQCIEVGHWTVTGAGATLTRSLPANVTAVGVPAKIIKNRLEGWQLTP